MAARREWLSGLALVIATFVAYGPTLSAGWVWDDDRYVTENLTVQRADGLRRIWLEPTSNVQYYPMVFSSYWLEHRLWGLNPAGYHVVNVALHAGAAFLLWRILRKLCIPGALFAAVVFALHPVQVESVAWVTERKNTLSGVFYLAAIWSYLRFTGDLSTSASHRRRWIAYGGSALFFLVALLSKTATFSLPAAILLLLWWKRTRVGVGDLLPLVPFVILGGVLTPITAWLEWGQVGARGGAWDHTLIERGLIAGRAVWFYLGKLLWPFGLMPTYPRWRIDVADARQFLWPVAAVVAMSLLFLLRRRIGRGPLAAALYYVVTLAPVLGFLNFYAMLMTFVGDHFQYLASLGPITLFASGAATLSTKLRWNRLRVAAATAVAVVLGVLTWRHSVIYKDEETLYRAMIAGNNEAWLGHENLGLILAQRGDLGEAIAHLRLAERFGPGDAQGHVNMGTVLALDGRTEDATEHFRKAVELDPASGRAHFNLACMLEASGDLNGAIDHGEMAASLCPDDAVALNKLGRFLAAANRPAEALARLKAATASRPNDPDFWFDLARMLEQLGRNAEAERSFERVLELSPDDAEARRRLQALSGAGAGPAASQAIP